MFIKFPIKARERKRERERERERERRFATKQTFAKKLGKLFATSVIDRDWFSCLPIRRMNLVSMDRLQSE